MFGEDSRRLRMRKRTYVVLGILALVAVMGVYGGGQGERAGKGGATTINYNDPPIIDRISGPEWIPPANFAAAIEGTTSLNVLNAGGIEFDPATDKNNKYFTQVTGIEINSIDISDIYQKAVAALGARSSALDVIYADHIMLWDFVYPQWLSTVDEMWDQESFDYYSPAIAQPIKVEGHYYGVPKYAQVYAFHYRPDLLKAAGLMSPPKTWDDVFAYAKKLTRGTDQYGYVFPMQNQRTAATYFHILVLQQEGKVVDDNGKVNYKTPEALAAMRFYVDMVQNGWAPEGVTSYEGGNAADLFYAGKAAMMIAKAYLWSEATGDEGQLVKGETYNQVVLPTPKAGASSYTYMDADYMAVSKFSEHQEAAKLYCDFIRSFQACKNEFVMEGNGSVTPAVYEDAEVKASHPYYDVAVAATNSARTQIYYQEMQVAKMLQNAMTDAVTGKKSPEEAIDDLQKQIDSLLGQ
jgi:ABC-type glycerol-3-phosphate transport system substrate-binding protein